MLVALLESVVALTARILSLNVTSLAELNKTYSEKFEVQNIIPSVH